MQDNTHMVETLGTDVDPSFTAYTDMVPTPLAFITLCVVLGITLISMKAAIHVRRDYQAFLALGPGGTPATWKGYLRIKCLSVFALRNPYQLAQMRAHHSAEGFLVGVATRDGPRPKTRGIAPHRQITQRASASIFQKLARATEQMARSNEHMVLGTSCFEKHGTGLFSMSPERVTCKGEIFHAHPSDGSMHMTLHPLDMNLVLEAGWGERHPLARGGFFEQFVPEGFMMIYAPRRQEEISTVLQIIEAAAWFVGGGLSAEGVKDPRRDSGYVSGEDGPEEKKAEQ